MADEFLVASDGLPARKAGLWAKEKLNFLDSFVPGALAATERKINRVFLDLFAGPGLNKVEDTGEEFPGSPLRVARLTAPRRPDLHFTRAIFCNLDAVSDEALFQRLERIGNSQETVVPILECHQVNSNEKARELMATIDDYAYVLAFADIEGVSQLPWSTISALRERHASVDLYVLVPVEMSFGRLLGTDPSQHTRHARSLNAYFGDESWRPIANGWLTNTQGRRVRAELLDLYRERLGTLWKHTEVVAVGRIGGARLLYRMVFASNHDAGRRIAKWCAKNPHSAQGELGIG